MASNGDGKDGDSKDGNAMPGSDELDVPSRRGDVAARTIARSQEGQTERGLPPRSDNAVKLV